MHEHLNAFAKLEFDKIKKHIQRYALSDIGRERVENLSPSSSLSDIRYSLSLVSEMKRLLNEDEVLPLESLSDIRSSLHRASIENYALSSEELRSIVRVLEVTRKVHAYFLRRKSGYPLLCEKSSAMYVDKVIEYNINGAISDEGTVKDGASKELASIRRQIEERKLSLRKNLEQILKSVAEKDWVQDDIITTREGRMVIPIKTEHKNRVPGFIHSTSASGATVFIEPTATLDLNNGICTLQFEEQREITKILLELTNQIRDHANDILTDVNILAELDFIYAKAKYSIELLGSEPHVVEKGRLTLIDARHPLLVRMHKSEHVVPLTLEIGENTNTLLITGPNAGGKSVAMKTVGLLTILAQAGCHIPASSLSHIRIFSDIFVDMGDEQSIENDLSSFSSHLQNLKIITEAVNDSSLVLIDEIASGTDPMEGASIAAAVLEHLSKVDCVTIATTHHGALKAFAFETPRFENGAMEFNQSTLEPTYKFRAGIPGSSYGIEMAERMKLPSEIIKRSVALRGEDTNKLESLILDLETKAQELKKNLDDISKEKERYGILNQLYVNKIANLQKELSDIKSKAINEGEAIVEHAKIAIEKTVREIKEKSADKTVVKSAREEVRRIEEEFNKLKSEILPDEEQNLQIGDIVSLKQSDSVGEITEQLDNDHFVVMVGAFRINADRDDLIKSTQKLTPTMRHSTQPSSIELSEVKSEIDLRGMYADEAINQIDKLFDTAIVTGIHRVSLIHGKGTGALRRKITNYLKNHTSIKSFRLGEWNEGGAGVTIVEL